MCSHAPPHVRAYRWVVRFYSRLYIRSPLAAQYTSRLQSDWLQVNRVTISVPGLPSQFDGFSLAHASDLHLGGLVRSEDGRTIVDRIMDLGADTIVLTGDLVDFTSAPSDGTGHVIRDVFSRLCAPKGVYAVLGNHDYYAGPEDVASAVAASGVTLLRNEGLLLEHSGSKLWLAGVNSVQLGQHDLDAALWDAPPGIPVILLAHEPDYADVVAKDERVTLQLSGHSHGGQICIPRLGPVRKTHMGRKYIYGLHRVGKMWLYINPGTGMAILPVRLNCPPEITLLRLENED